MGGSPDAAGRNAQEAMAFEKPNTQGKGCISGISFVVGVSISDQACKEHDFAFPTYIAHRFLPQSGVDLTVLMEQFLDGPEVDVDAPRPASPSR